MLGRTRNCRVTRLPLESRIWPNVWGDNRQQNPSEYARPVGWYFYAFERRERSFRSCMYVPCRTNSYTVLLPLDLARTGNERRL
jgi:hypothetical protein